MDSRDIIQRARRRSLTLLLFFFFIISNPFLIFSS